MKDLKHILPILKQQGLNDKEIELYTRSLKLGPQRVSKLCQYTSINRNTAQYTCQQLVQKRLMSVCPEKNSFIFTAEPPEKLLLLLEEEKRVFHNREQNLSQAVEILKTIKPDQDTPLPQIKYFQGAQGIIEMYEDTLQSRETIYAATRIEPKALPEVNQYIQERYVPERKKNKNSAWILLNDNEASQNYRKNDADVNRVSMTLPTERFPFDTCLHIYGNKVALFSFKMDDATGILIENKAIKNTMMSLFKLSWNFAKTLPENSRYRDLQI